MDIMRFLRRVPSIPAVALIAGCVSFSSQVQEHTIAYNIAQEDTTNQILLLNALRARDGRPMHFTTMSKITGNIELSTEAGLNIPFGENVSTSDSVNELSPGFSVSSNPSFDVIPENKSAFIKGITSPITLELFNRFWQQGWPKDLLVLMLIKKVELVPPEAGRDKLPIVVLLNEPDYPSPHETCARKTDDAGNAYLEVANRASDGSEQSRTFSSRDIAAIDTGFLQSDWCSYQLFRLVVDDYLPQLRLVERAGTPQAFTISKESFTLEDLKTLSEILQNASFTAESTSEGLRVTVTPAKQVVSCMVEDTRMVPADVFSSDVCLGSGESSSPEGGQALAITQGRDGAVTRSPRYKAYAHFRSPQGALFYLGEILRTQQVPGAVAGFETVCVVHDSGFTASAYCPDKQVPLFLARVSRTGDVVVPYRDNLSYAIPGGVEGGRSMMALSLLTQLFGLSREASELPSTQTVNVLN